MARHAERTTRFQGHLSWHFLIKEEHLLKFKSVIMSEKKILSQVRCSVVIVLFNSATTLEACLQSVLRVISGSDEVILVDNGSVDNCGEVASSYAKRDPRIRLVKNGTNRGYAPAANQGVAESQGRYIIFLNPDTVVQPGLIESLIQRLEDPNVGAVGPLCNEVSGRQFVGHHLPQGRSPAETEVVRYLYDSYYGGSEETKLLIGFCLALRRETLDKLGYLDDDCVLGSDDLELSWRLRLNGYRLLIAKDSFVTHRHGTSFRSLPDAEKDRLVRQSNLALKAKLTRYYGSLDGITSDDLWGCPIFDPILEPSYDQEPPHDWRTVPGWFDFQDIYDYAVQTAPEGSHFVEIGCWLGRSTCYLAQAIKRSGKAIRLTVVDTFSGVPGDELQELLLPFGGSVHAAFIDNIRRCGVDDIVEVIVGNSTEAHSAFKESSLGMVFIDADHSYEGVSADIRNFLPKVVKGGLIGGHDYTEAPGVRQAVLETVGPCPASHSSWLFRVL